MSNIVSIKILKSQKERSKITYKMSDKDKRKEFLKKQNWKKRQIRDQKNKIIEQLNSLVLIKYS